MSHYKMPVELKELRGWLSERGVDVEALASERQCAFLAMKLSDQRIKFPPRGKSVFPVLRRLQAIVRGDGGTTRPIPELHASYLDGVNFPAIRGRDNQTGNPKKRSFPRNGQREQARLKPVAEPGLAIYCDGVCEPNPGAGGWGYVVYLDGCEIDCGYGGLVETTNNQMEIQGLLAALWWLGSSNATEPALILCDSRYVVDGINQWVSKWKANGGRRRGDSAKTENQEIKNVNLWKAVDSARENLPYVSIGWVKGHVGHLGNERADELALIGREEAIESQLRSAMEIQLDGGRL